jgi:hypothetical protein
MFSSNLPLVVVVVLDSLTQPAISMIQGRIIVATRTLVTVVEEVVRIATTFSLVQVPTIKVSTVVTVVTLILTVRVPVKTITNVVILRPLVIMITIANVPVATVEVVIEDAVATLAVEVTPTIVLTTNVAKTEVLIVTINPIQNHQKSKWRKKRLPHYPLPFSRNRITSVRGTSSPVLVTTPAIKTSTLVKMMTALTPMTGINGVPLKQSKHSRKLKPLPPF